MTIPMTEQPKQAAKSEQPRKKKPTEKGFLFNKKHKVSIWASTIPYAEIPDAYFEETFSKNNTRASNQWSRNFKIRYFDPSQMETNGTHEGLVDIQKAVGECSFSRSFMPVLLSKAKKKNLLSVSWVVLLYEFEYSSKISAVEKDQFLTLVGAFDYDDDAESLYEVQDSNE